MQAKQEVDLRKYKELIETISRVEFQKLSSSAHLIEYLELVNIATHTLYVLFKNQEPENFNNSYLSTAIKWAIRNEIRRRYKWYSLKNKKPQNSENKKQLREAVYKTILSIDEMAESESPSQVRDEDRTPEELLEFRELKKEVLCAIKTLPERERMMIESKFFKNKKLREMSAEFGISPSRISRIIQTGLDKIKKELIKQQMI